MIRITGTFLDDIPHDLPSQNWSARDWQRDFEAMRQVGIDTVILSRAGYRRHATFDSDVLRATMNTFPVHNDVIDLFLEEAERCRMTFYFGTYESGTYWEDGKYEEEVALNRAFSDEVIDRYGDRAAFGGWYIAQSIASAHERAMEAFQDLAAHLRSLKDVPILISPYLYRKTPSTDGPISIDEHEAAWTPLFEQLQDAVDIVAFPDGDVSYEDLPRYLAANHELAQAYGLTSWSTVESYEAGIGVPYASIDYRKLRYKMACAHESEAEKLITYEFSHFMSPNSTSLAARNLSGRYRDWLEEQYYARHA
jgi:hypothetical protein